MAIDPHILFVGGLNGTNKVRMFSLDFNEMSEFDLDRIDYSKDHGWSNYIRGVADQLIKAGYSLKGMDMVLQGDIPQGGGLSSSAALEVGAALLMSELNGLNADRVELVKLSQKAENEFVGVNCGIMDQFASMMGELDHALFLDCRTLEYELVRTGFEDMGYSVVVIHSGVKRGLVDGEYISAVRSVKRPFNSCAANCPISQHCGMWSRAPRSGQRPPWRFSQTSSACSD